MIRPPAPTGENAAALQNRGQSLAAVKTLREQGRKQLRQRQDLAGILETARALCGLYDYGTATALLDAVVRLAGTEPALLVRLTLMLIREGQYADAARFAREALDRAASGSGAALDALLLLAECEDRLGHAESAAGLAREALQKHPDSIPAHRLLAAILRREGRPEEALALLRGLLDRGGPPHWETCRAWFELGQVQDQLGNYAAAWQAWITARNFHDPDVNWKTMRQQADHVWDHVRGLHQSLTREQAARWTAAAAQAPETASRMAVLTGHPRSGTTLLEQSLDAHSGILSMEETTIFTSSIYRPLFQHGPQRMSAARRLDGMEDREWRHWRREYRGLARLALGQDPGQRLLIDKNPDLLQLLPAWLRIFPAAKMIVMLRDPRDLLVSMFSQALPPNHTAWSYRSPESAAAMISLRLGLWHHLRQLLPRSVFHEVRYEQLIRDFPGVVGGVLDFLGCSPEAATLRPELHSRQKVVLSPSYASVQSPVHQRAEGRWRHYEPWLAPHLKALRPALAGLGYAG
ncbi:MAG: sulfotransferase [Verrucomicrobiota bacterium]